MVSIHSLNMIDLFIPCSGSSGILWLIFLVIVHVLLLNLVLDTLVAAYTKYSEEQEEAVTEEKVQGILNVFQTVSRVTGSSVITRQTFMDFCEARFARSGAVGVVGVVLQNCWDTLQKFLEDRWSWKCNRPQKILSRWLWVNNEPYYPRKYAKEQGCICSVLGNVRPKKNLQGVGIEKRSRSCISDRGLNKQGIDRIFYDAFHGLQEFSRSPGVRPIYKETADIMFTTMEAQSCIEYQKKHSNIFVSNTGDV